jgi:hypothetical protein
LRRGSREAGTSTVPDVVIHIDKRQYRVPSNAMTGAQLRSLPPSPVHAEFDLYQEGPGGRDILIKNDVSYALRNGMHFFTAPSYWS